MSDVAISNRRISVFDILRAERNVLAALMLRDIKTRFGSAPAFLITVAWPLAHMLIVLGISIFLGRAVPYGESAVLWFSISMTPFMITSYTSRSMMMGMIMNRPLLAFPVISVFDILLSRVLIEIIVVIGLLIGLAFILVCLDIDFMPIDISLALAAIGASLLLGIGLGVLNAIIAMILPQWAIVYSLSLILLWATSGVYFVPSALDGALQIFLSYHPFLHGIEWIREAYFPGYHSTLLDKAYLLGCGLWSVSVGLVLERLLRGRVLLA